MHILLFTLDFNKEAKFLLIMEMSNFLSLLYLAQHCTFLGVIALLEEFNHTIGAESFLKA